MERAIKARDKGSVPFLLFLLLWPAVLLILFLVCVRVWQVAQKPAIRHQIQVHLDERTAQAEADLAVADGYTWTGDMYIPESGDSVWYRETGFGIAPSSREFGYCYSMDGKPRPYPGMEDYNEIPVTIGFRWEEADGDNGCYIEHIAGHFYYFEVWF